MPELVEQMYCSRQIVIPPKFPYILKRYCKAAIKTQPYDLLRWSYEYFKALAEHRPPPVKLRLEYPVYSTEGGLTRGCLKVLAHQLSMMQEIPLSTVRAAWRGFCLDPEELKRILCICEVHMRQEKVSFLHFIAGAGGLLTKCLTNTMILLCESLTKEPDGGSAAIPLNDFLTMYKFLARIDASQDVKYFNGYKEGDGPAPESEEEESTTSGNVTEEDSTSDDYWLDTKNLQKISLIDDKVTRSTRLSVKLNMPIVGKLSRSASLERAEQIDRENYLMERKGRPAPSQEVLTKLRAMSAARMSTQDDAKKDVQKPKEEAAADKPIDIIVFDEDDVVIPFTIYGEPEAETLEAEESPVLDTDVAVVEEEDKAVDEKEDEYEKVALFLAECEQRREERIEDLEKTFDDIKAIVDKFKSANYDLGMIAGRQMSTTSGEFIVQHIEKEMMTYVDDQIAILPDPDLKKKKAKPEEVEMIRGIVEDYLEENMDVIVPELEEIEEEEQAIPDVVIVYAVPGIGGPVDEDIVKVFEEYAKDVAKVQSDLLMPRNIRHFLCPPLEKHEETYDDKEKESKEEIPTGGVFAH